MIKLAEVFLCITFFVSCSQIKMQSEWQNSIQDIDGDASDWELIPVVYNDDPPFVVAATNNENNLQLMLRFNDQVFARTLLMRGFTFWFDKDENFGIDYMGRLTARTETGRRQEGDSALRRNKMMFKALESEDFEVIDKKSGSSLALSEVHNLEANIGKKGQTFCLEISVPIKNDLARCGVEIKSGKYANLVLKVKELQRPARQKQSGLRPSGGISAGRGGGMGSGRSGGRRGGSPGLFQRADTGSKEYKMKVALAAETQL